VSSFGIHLWFPSGEPAGRQAGAKPGIGVTYERFDIVKICLLGYPVVPGAARRWAAERDHPQRRTFMTWKSPKIVEIALGAEINSYACAEAAK
jgi:coenzyme PQQ precursor peptide PqqA